MTDIVQQSNSGNTVAAKHVTLAYNKLHQFTSIVRYESTSTSNYVATTDFGYDNLHRLTDLDHYQGGTALNAYDYGYDFASRMTSVTTTLDGVTNYTNDKTNQLTGADFTGQTDETYTFDDNGNRIGGSYTVTANNLTSTDGTYNYQYDDEGNRTRRTKISNSSYEEYTWDYRNRLTAVTFKNSGGTVLKTVTYEYDAFNRLVRRTYDADGPGPGGAAAADQFWAHDNGIDPLIEFDGATASDVSHRYLWGPQVDQLFADEQVTSTGSAGNILWALGNNLNTPTDIADLSGGATTITNHRRFGAYGNLVSETNSAVDLAFGNTGKFYDEVTGLLFHVNRWYDPFLGQWLSEDPKGLDPDANARRYVGNGPQIRLDPDGLDWGDFGWGLLRNTVPIIKYVEDTGHMLHETGTVWHNTQGQNWVSRGYTTIGTTIGTQVGVRGVSDAFSNNDAVDGHEQSVGERVIDGGTGTVTLISTAFGLKGLFMGAAGAGAPRTSAGRPVSGRPVNGNPGNGTITPPGSSKLPPSPSSSAPGNGTGTLPPTGRPLAGNPGTGRPVNGTSPPTGSQPTNGLPPVEIIVDPSKYPASAQHLIESGAVNRPLTVNRVGAGANRRAALKGEPKVQGMDLDESPPAMLRQPNDSVSVKPIPRSDNRGSGSSIGHQARGVPNGGTVVIRVRGT